MRICQHGTCRRLVNFKRSNESWFCGAHKQKREKRLRPFETQYNVLVRNQKSRKSRLSNGKRNEVRMSYEEFVKICVKQVKCFYCSLDVERVAYPSRKQMMDKSFRDKEVSSLDRLNPDKHYTVKNVVTCCPTCNMTRNRFMSVEEMVVLGAIREGNLQKAFGLATRNKLKLLKWAHHLRQEHIFGILGFGGKKANRKIKDQ